MPRVSVWLVRASLLHLLAGSLLGATYLAWKAGFAVPAVAWSLTVHQELLLAGWIVQLVVGVAFWILPRRPDRDPGADSVLMWVVIALLNGGVLASVAGFVASAPWLVPVGRASAAVSVALFVRHAWYRQRRYREGARSVLV